MKQRELNEFQQTKRWYKDRKETFDPDEPYPAEPEYKGDTDEEWYEYNRYWKEWDQYRDLHKERGVRPLDRRRITETYEKYGLRVKLKVKELPDEEYAYDLYNKDPPLLQIYTEPYPTDEFFDMAFKKVKGANPYHISLCYANELHRFNLYDAKAGLRVGMGAYERLRNVCNGQIAFFEG